MVEWPHAPVHHFEDASTFFATGGTYLKQHFYRTPAALNTLQNLLFRLAAQFECWLQAWCLLSNHYHLVAYAERGEAIKKMLDRFHSEAAIELNQVEGQSPRS